MNVSNWIALAGVAGGWTIAVAKLTRIAVAVEQLVRAFASVRKDVDDHEQRLTKGGL